MPIQQEFDYVFDLIKNARNKALQSVNSDQIVLYWTIGQFVQQKLDASEWGEGTVKNLSLNYRAKTRL